MGGPLVLLLSSLVIAGFGLAPAYYGTDRAALHYELPPLDFTFHDLEPYLDGETVRIHYTGHHAKYTEKMNHNLREWRKKDKHASRMSIIEILRNLSHVPEKYRDILRKNGGGFVNHNFYWAVMSPNKRGIVREPAGELLALIKNRWESFANFQSIFSDAANNVFGSGYVWLCRNYSVNQEDSELTIITTANQDSPLLMGPRLYPILVIDVWEHAYYLKFRNVRAQYVDNWWKLVDWDLVSQLDKWWLGIRHHDEL